MRFIRVIAVLCLFAGISSAQSTSAISGTIRDLSNAVVTSGEVTFELVPGIDTTASGIARFTPSTVTCTITALGAVKALDGISTCTITQNTSLAPPNTAYKVCIHPQFISPGSCFIMYATTSSIDITTVTPTPSQMPSYNLVDTFSNQSIAGNKTFTGNITFGGTLSLGAITLGGNLNMGGNSITNANAGTFSGNVSVGGTLGVTGAITAASYTTPTANPATAGLVRLAVGDTECWRNFANGGNVCLSDAGAASSTTGNLADLMKWSGGGFQGAAFVDQSAAPANSGVLRVGNNVVAVAARNAASGADVAAVLVNAANLVALGSGPFLIPAVSDTAVGKATTDTLTNKTLTSPVINGTPTGTGIPTVTLKKGTGVGSYSSASTSYAQVDGTNLTATITIPTGWKLIINSSFRIGTLTAVVACNAALADGGSVVVETSTLTTGIGIAMPASLSWAITGDGAAHTVDLRYKTSNAADSVTIGNSSATDVPTMVFLLTPSN